MGLMKTGVQLARLRSVMPVLLVWALACALEQWSARRITVLQSVALIQALPLLKSVIISTMTAIAKDRIAVAAVPRAVAFVSVPAVLNLLMKTSARLARHHWEILARWE